MANAALIAAWSVTRLWGPPFGPQAGVEEAVSSVDLTCVALEALLIVAGAALLLRPHLGSASSRRMQAFLSVVPIGILAVATAALASPSAADHGHHGDAAETAGVTHVHGGASTGAEDGHAHGAGAGGATPVAGADDQGLSEVMNGQGEGGGHTHDIADVPLDAATQRRLDAQLAETETLIERYPTVGTAEAAGYYRSGPFSPGLGAHYIRTVALNSDGDMDVEDLARPTLIYDGITPDSKLAGFMYLVMSLDTEHAPEGFAGPNDHWHYHTNVCITARPGGGVDAPLGADTTASKELCDTYGGSLIANTGYMLHVWTVPGYESPQGVFSNVNARIHCSDGTYYVVEPQEIGHRTSTCRNE